MPAAELKLRPYVRSTYYPPARIPVLHAVAVCIVRTPPARVPGPARCATCFPGRCARASGARGAARTTDRAGTPPACAAPSSSARPASAGTRSPRPTGARVRTTAVVPSYCATSSSTIRPRSRKSRVIGVPRIRRRMLDVRPVDVARARTSRLASIDSRVSSGLPTIRPPTTNMPWRCRCSIASMVALPTVRPCSRCAFFARALQEREVVVEDVLDAEEHVAEAGARISGASVAPCCGDRRRHRLHDVVDVVEARRR